MDAGWVVGLGEVLWDVFPDETRFGGAPANFACHASALGARAAIVSAVGPASEELANDALRTLTAHRVDVSAITRGTQETGRVLVEVDADGHASYRFTENPAWDFIDWSQAAADIAHNAHAVCFGTLAQRNAHSRETIGRFVSEMRPDALRVFDVNLRVNYWSDERIVSSLRMANVFKLNSDELPIVARACGITPSGNQSLQAIREKFDLRMVAFTDGSRGATLVTADAIDHCSAPTIDVRDTVGAGDSYTAAMTLGLLKGWPLSQINERAVAVAAYVCTQAGATPSLPPQITLWFADQ